MIEILVIISMVIVLIIFLIPSFVRSGHRSLRIECVNNLKQVGLAFRIWAGDHQDNFPMDVSTNVTGSRRYFSGSDVFRPFEIMSNELNSPKVLFCPSDTDRKKRMASTFDKMASRRRGTVPLTGNVNISYFVGVDATPSNSIMFLVGDRNITNGSSIMNGLLELKTNQPIGWTAEMHNMAGNIGLADGSVQQVTSQGLRDLLKQTDAETTRLAMP